MKPFDVAELTLLAALWGASFLFMRMGAGEFGPVALAALRVGGAALLLLPLLAWRGQFGALHAHWRSIFVVGVANSALPFLAFSYAALSITAGLSAIFNATTPLFGGLIAWLWLKDRPGPARALGWRSALPVCWVSRGTRPASSRAWTAARPAGRCWPAWVLRSVTAGRPVSRRSV
jgi:drug/metabolite transporter (DMT)-like permease